MSAPATVPPPTQPHERGTGSASERVTTTAPTVVGDGTSARSRARSRWRRVVWPLAVLVTLALVAVLIVVLRPATSTTPLAPDNPEGAGSRALAQILADQGVDVRYVRTSGQAVAAAREGTTLLLAGSYLLMDEQVEDLASTEADLVLLEAESWHIHELTDGAVDLGYATGTGEVDASCDDPDAQAAGSIDSDGYGLTALSPDVELCFLNGDTPLTGAYASVEADGRRVVVIDDSTLFMNARLAEDGNAALALRTLGRHDSLVWYVPSINDLGGEAGTSAGAVLPAWAGPVSLQLLVLALALALWQGRALGRVVTEPLPVTVRAVEATLGRGRLYRRARSRGHAAAALRAGMARRGAARLGLPRSAGAPEVIDGLARATGRSTEQVAHLLYGPPPTDDDGLLALARQLDELESEVHRT
ncbi:DUF4350 domain-containing protein [Actinotalea subterranea]|uniref:DUF4350 domain-containing protein n=1 Tax=Actinotalea subterranea TaxID=2607497 RepID=UPI0011EEFFD3|nr:DUF4350 domain-containing protein [Actinotalea subterranea]